MATSVLVWSLTEIDRAAEIGRALKDLVVGCRVQVQAHPLVVRSREQWEPVRSHCLTSFSGFECVVGLPKGVGRIVTTVAKGLATEPQWGEASGRSGAQIG